MKKHVLIGLLLCVFSLSPISSSLQVQADTGYYADLTVSVSTDPAVSADGILYAKVGDTIAFTRASSVEIGIGKSHWLFSPLILSCDEGGDPTVWCKVIGKGDGTMIYSIDVMTDWTETKSTYETFTAPTINVHITDGTIASPEPVASTNIFSDVSENHPNAIAIETLKERNIIGGYPDGTFKPDNTVNRAELLKILVEGKIGTPDASEYKNCFPDVKTEWFAPYVCYAKSAGWVEGYSNGTFKPSQTVNKVEALKMLLNSQDIFIPDTADQPFEDVKTTDWFAKYVSKAKELGILEETGDTFTPSGGMKRAGISENLYRLLIKAE